MSIPTRLFVAATVVVSFSIAATWARHLGMPSELAVAKQEFRSLPLSLGRWKGEHAAVDKRVVQGTGAESTVDRLYRNVSGQVVILHSALFSQYELTPPHPPELCYSVAGFRIVDSTSVELPIVESTKVAVRLLTVERNGHVTYVLYWYQLEDRVFLDSYGQRAAILSFRGQKTRPRMIKVMLQIAVPQKEAAKELLTDFALPLAQWTSQYR